VKSLGLCSACDVITFDQNWHHPYSTSPGEQNLFDDIQIRVIGSMTLKICAKILKKLSEKLRPKFPAATCAYSMVKIARLDDAFSESFEQKASQVEGQSVQKNETANY